MPSAFDDVRLPEEIEQGSQGGPQFQTTIITLSTGFEQRNVDWPSQRCVYDISYGVLNRTDYQDVINFFYARQGRARGFRFKDWSDYRADTPQAIGTGNAVTTTFQLVKNYPSAAGYVRKITRPVSGTVAVSLNGVNQPSGWTVNLSTGLITFAVAPGVGVAVTATFEFDVPVRFDTDRLSIVMQTRDAVSISSCPVVEIRE